MSVAKSCFFGCAFPTLLVLFVGVLFYSQAQEYTTSDIQNKITTLRRQVARALASEPPGQTKNNQPVPILMYHFVRDGVDEEQDPTGYRLSVPESQFKEQMAYLANNGFTTISLESFLAGYYPDKAVVLTFDDAYRDFRDVVYPVLAEHNFTATTFVITNRLNDPNHLNVADLQFLADKGIEIGSHTASHANLASLNRSQQRSELEDSRAKLESIINRPVVTMAYPSGHYNAIAQDMVSRARYEVAVTTKEGWATHDGLFKLPRVRISRNLTIEQFANLVTKPRPVVTPTSSTN